MAPKKEGAPETDPSSVETGAEQPEGGSEADEKERTSIVVEMQKQLLNRYLDEEFNLKELLATAKGDDENAADAQGKITNLGGEDGVQQKILTSKCQSLYVARSLVEIPAEQLRKELGLEGGNPQTQVEILQTGLEFWERQEKRVEDPLNAPDFPDDCDQIIGLQDRSTELSARIDQDKELFSQKSKELKAATKKADKDRIKGEMEEIDQRIEASGRDSDELKNSLEKIAAKYGDGAEQMLDNVADYRQIKTELAGLKLQEDVLDSQIEQASGLDTLGGEGAGEMISEELEQDKENLERSRSELQERLLDMEDLYLPPGEKPDENDETVKEVRGEIEIQRRRLEKLRQENPDKRSQREIESDMEAVKEKIFDLEAKLKTGRTVKENIAEKKRRIQTAEDLSQHEERIGVLNERLEKTAEDLARVEGNMKRAAEAAILAAAVAGAERAPTDDGTAEVAGAAAEATSEKQPAAEAQPESPSRAERSKKTEKMRTVDKPSRWNWVKRLYSGPSEISAPVPTKKQEKDEGSVLKRFFSGLWNIFKR
ncbi:hypothetical protein COY93_00920 [Candidatus Uhrbacteria bacterium CG_4_10_14_0_8_um_filter_58_22]|uniref:Uncharacterized protein n=1 Tax=Candidatus Uhrbacteria bacterium CG_4_10_14_0_8_um_filter_58_22 TaxID=1975029 RepID=A0A2M7QAQ9_9BACT|nr:MAG: hypothetical protein AUJ19_03530 [Parcubacteria group bacterium CG1_02_58_44]PIY63229.1 MAG: hypothetical protein COY93_00920 [Candidatus Uhrbacteria bacterium CG_4_10_14_0_8_um_filter_58_22]